MGVVGGFCSDSFSPVNGISLSLNFHALYINFIYHQRHRQQTSSIETVETKHSHPLIEAVGKQPGPGNFKGRLYIRLGYCGNV